MKRLIPHIAFALGATLMTPVATAQVDWFNAANKVAGSVSRNNAERDKIANMSEADEISLGRKLAGGVLAQQKPLANEALQRYLNKVGMWVALQSPRPALPWRFVASDAKNINAYALPGGIVVVTQGMLQALSNEAELGCVLGHEVGHVSRKHHLTVLADSLTQKGWIEGVTEAAGDEIGGKGMGGQIAVGALKAPLQELVGKYMSLSLDRGAESEADQDGVLLAAKAGYDPAACLTFMQRLASTKTQATLMESLSKTHPSAQSRSEDIEATLRRLKGATPGEGARPLLTLQMSADEGTGKKKK